LYEELVYNEEPVSNKKAGMTKTSNDKEQVCDEKMT